LFVLHDFIISDGLLQEFIYLRNHIFYVFYYLFFRDKKTIRATVSQLAFGEIISTNQSAKSLLESLKVFQSKNETKESKDNTILLVLSL
jgi:hypothetical protein